ncbi:hypothetical protein NCCP28_06340 [Niallia sp. NCCP-28]|nr:hypothetical protein NCCP28_06340 [Niallia sp. NCCP-28]
MIGKVTVWKMTEEERLAFIKKYPIVPTEPPKGSSLANIGERKRKEASENGARRTKERWEKLSQIE